MKHGPVTVLKLTCVESDIVARAWVYVCVWHLSAVTTTDVTIRRSLYGCYDTNHAYPVPRVRIYFRASICVCV